MVGTLPPSLVELRRTSRFAHPTKPTLRRALAFIGALQAIDIELDHAEHRLHGALRPGGIGAAEIFWQRGRHDLPRYAVTVLQPAAVFGFAAIRQQCIPEPIDLGLIGTVDHEGN